MKFVLSFLLFLQISILSLAQQSPQRVQFENLTAADGLPENSVRCMVQDHLGYMWLGTQNGLVLYDGIKMKNFQSDPKNPYSMKGRQIRALHEDRNGDVWIACESLYRFERATQRFIEYPRKSPEKVENTDAILFIHEDKQGNIWTITSRNSFSTNVLDRYNPKTDTWTYFRHNPTDKHSLNSNKVYISGLNNINVFSFLEKETGEIWITTITEKGNILNKFDPKTNQFSRFKPVASPAVLKDFERASTITAAPNGMLYVTTSFEAAHGLFLVNPRNGQLKQYKHDPKNPNSLRCDSLSKVHIDKSGKVWIPTMQGIDMLDPKTEIFTHIISKPDDPTSPGSGIFTWVDERPNGDMWFVTPDGLNFYEKKSNKFVRYKTDSGAEGELIVRNNIWSLLVDNTGLVWVGTWGAGLNKQSRLTRFPVLTAKADNPNSLQSQNVSALYVAPSEPSVIWFGSEKGLDKLDKKTGKYSHYRYDSLNHYSIGKGWVTGIAEDKKGRFWVSVLRRGIYLMDRKTGQFALFSPNKTDANISAFYYVTGLFPASDGTLWTTDFAEVNHIDTDNKKFTYYYKTDSTYTPELFSFVNNLIKPEIRIASLLHVGNYADRTMPFVLPQSAEVLVVTQGDLNPPRKNDYGWIEDMNGKIVWEMTYKESVNDGHSNCRVQTQLVRLTAGSYRLRYKSDNGHTYNNWPGMAPYHYEWNGIQLLRITEPEKKTFKNLILHKIKRDGFYDQSLFFVKEDSKKRIWIGMNSGLSMLDPTTGKFTSFYDYINGPNCVVALSEDIETDNLWIGDYSLGLLLMQPDGKVIKRYTTNNGLPSNSIFRIERDAKGFLWLATNNGICRFDPKTGRVRNFNKSNGLQGINYANVPSFQAPDGEMYFVEEKGITVFYPDQIKDDAYLPQVVLSDLSISGKLATLGKDQQMPVHISVANDIKLPHNQNDITFHYTALHYNRGKESQYAFRLLPNDKDWIQAGNQQQARYTGLAPGTYTFQVKAANADGVWNEKGTSITLTILPPWWLTWWAYAIYILTFAAILRAYIVYRSRTLQAENKILEEKVELRTKELENSLETLKSTQAQLIQKEKLASLGELTAGIAHEIQNPLNFVNNFSELSVDLIKELKEERKKEKGERDEALEDELLDDLAMNQEKINHHGKRASSIVKGMLEHSRSSTGIKELIDINALADEYLRLAYHGLRAKDNSFNATIETHFEENLPEIALIPQDIGRVLLNLFNNAFYAANVAQTGSPWVQVSTKKLADSVEIRIKDNGNGMSEATKAKIFQPFFTTKPTGEGTGLGLSLAYDIITKGHGGTIEVETKEGEGSEFIIKLPIKTNAG